MPLRRGAPERDEVGHLAAALLGAGKPARAASRTNSSRTTCWKIAPQAAIPVAIPTWRNVELMPEAMPERRGSTTPIAAVASAGLTNPMPPPAIMKPASSAVQSSPASRPPISSRPVPTSASPPPMNQRTPTRSASCREIGATTNESSVTGMKRRPDSSAQ